MCGFSGYFNWTATKSPTEVLTKMGKMIQHRGPDARGIWFDQFVGLVHQRLAIVELSDAGAQPMVSQSQRFVLAFNGEIYNHLELRHLLASRAKNVSWRGHSDTETLLSCFELLGFKETLSAARGMFSLALYDRLEKQVYLARDRVGEKPLYYSNSDKGLIFSSELKSLKQHPIFNDGINADAISDLLRFGFVNDCRSIYHSVNKVEPGNYMLINSSGSTKQESYVHLGVELNLHDYGSKLSFLDGLISKSVSEQLQADVEVGAFLSGGVDSTLICSYINEVKGNFKTFSIGFNEDGYNEAQHAKQLAHYFGSEHHELYVSSHDTLKLVEELPKIYCEPFSDPSAIPTILLSRLAKEHVTVALSGDGGDELFGGYSRYQNSIKMWKNISSIPLFARGNLADIDLPISLLNTLGKSFLQNRLLGDKLSKGLNLLGAKSFEEYYFILRNHAREFNIKGENSERNFSSSNDNWLRCLMNHDFHNYLPSDILVKVDRAAMSTSLETRIPLLDPRVINFSKTLDNTDLIGTFGGKHILRDLLYSRVPRELVDRPKKGFSVPISRWLQHELSEYSKAIIMDSPLLIEFFDKNNLEQIHSEHQSGKRDWSFLIWNMINLSMWYEYNK